MSRLRFGLVSHTIVPLLVLMLLPSARAKACGHFPEAERAEDYASALRTFLSGESLPVLAPELRAHYLVLAWARTQGKQFSDSEIEALASEADLARWNPFADLHHEIEHWKQARAAVPNSGPVDVRGFRVTEHYSYGLICPPDAFRTATQTLENRRTTLSTEELARWLSNQDRVFQNCQSETLVLPEALPQAASAALRLDHAYQEATAYLFQRQWQSAATRFDAIAADPASPWADIARYRAAYAGFHGGFGTAVDIRHRMTQTSDVKARRGLQQLLDRTELFQAHGHEVVRTLSQRLWSQDLGHDIVRVLRDIVVFMWREPGATPPDTTLIERHLATPGDSPTTWSALHRLMYAEVDALDEADAHLLEQDPLFHLNGVFYRVRRLIARGALPEARRVLRQNRPAIVRSTLSTRNAFLSLELRLAQNANQALAFLLRFWGGQRISLAADSREALRRMSSAQWLRLAQAEGSTEAFRRDLLLMGFVRNVLLERWPVAQRFLRVFLEQTRATGPHDDLRRELESLQGLRGNAFRIQALLALGRVEPGEFSIQDEFAVHWADLPQSGCQFGRCGARDPSVTMLGRTHSLPNFRPDAERRALANLGTRISAFGQLALSLTTQFPDDERVPEILHRFVRLTRRASIHHVSTPEMGPLSRQAFQRLHRDYPGSPFTTETRHWYN